MIPAGKQIKIPRKKTRAIEPLGSLNLSDKKKYNKIRIDGTIVIKRVVIFYSQTALKTDLELLLFLKVAFAV